jgi:hypothetical protein
MTDAGQPTAGLDDSYGSSQRAAGPNPETSQRESLAAAIHELSERLTDATNYVASCLRVAELAMAEKTNCSTLEKAAARLDRASEVLHALRKLLQEHGA